jgi:hypothetical protein
MIYFGISAAQGPEACELRWEPYLGCNSATLESRARWSLRLRRWLCSPLRSARHDLGHRAPRRADGPLGRNGVGGLPRVKWFMRREGGVDSVGLPSASEREFARVMVDEARVRRPDVDPRDAFLALLDDLCEGK